MTNAFSLTMDMHVHSTYSDGKGTLVENIQAAEARGLAQLCCVDHVRETTDWLPTFVADVEGLRATTDLKLYVGVEAKIIDESGALDLPADLTGVDVILAADHRFPMGDTSYVPRDVKRMLTNGKITPEQAVTSLINATIACMERYAKTPQTLVLAHVFSILPRVGLSETLVTWEQLEQLAAVARTTGTIVEVSERWSCPSARSAWAFHRAGVPIFASSDAHEPAKIGQYLHVRRVSMVLGFLSQSQLIQADTVVARAMV